MLLQCLGCHIFPAKGSPSCTAPSWHHGMPAAVYLSLPACMVGMCMVAQPTWLFGAAAGPTSTLGVLSGILQASRDPLPWADGSWAGARRELKFEQESQRQNARRHAWGGHSRHSMPSQLAHHMLPPP